MAYPNQEKDKRPKSPFDLFQLNLWAPSTAQGKRAMFMVDVGIDGKVQFIVRTGDPADKEKGKDGDNIKFRLSLTDFEKLTKVFGDVIRSKGEIKVAAVEQVYFRFDKATQQRVRMDQPRDGIQLFMVKDSEGKIALSLVQYNKPKIEFGFLAERPEVLFAHGDGSKYSDAEMSQSGAWAYHKLMTELHLRVSLSTIRQHQVPDLYQPPYVPPQGNGGGGGYNKGGNSGGGGGYNKGNGGGGGGGGGGQRAAVVEAEVDMDDDDVPY